MPSSTVLTLSDPYEFQTSNRDVQHKVVLTARGAYRGEATRIDLHRLLIRRGWQSLPTIWHAVTPKERSAVVFPTSQTPGTWVGIEVQPGDILFRPKGGEHHVHSPENMHYGSLSLSADDLAAFGRALLGRDLNEPPGSRVVRAQPAAMSRLLRLHEATGHLAKTAPEILAIPAVAKGMEQELIRAMVACLAEPSFLEPRERARNHARVIARFEDYLRERRYEPVFLGDICAAIGVSGRTLHACCQEHFGTSPLHYLWLRRMNLVRHTLLKADPLLTTVTAIATEYGFWELGRFSVQYRAMFGESPKDTLRRPPVELPVPG